MILNKNSGSMDITERKDQIRNLCDNDATSILTIEETEKSKMA